MAPGDLAFVKTQAAALWANTSDSDDVGVLDRGDVIIILGERVLDTSDVEAGILEESYPLFPVMSRLGLGWLWCEALEAR